MAPALREATIFVNREQQLIHFLNDQFPLPVQRSSGTFTVIAGSDPHTATVTVRTTFEPLDPTGVDQLSGIVHGAFQQSLESLRRFVEDNISWDASRVLLDM